jgi:hypothetical protein
MNPPSPGAVALAQGAVFLENIDNLAEGEWSELPPPMPCWAATWRATRCAAASRNSWSCGT